MNILGIVTKSHDTGVALLKEGVPHFVLEEERFNREKHTMGFPSEALAAGFDGSFGVAFRDVDVITTPWDMKRLRWTIFNTVTGKMPQSLNLLWPSAHKTQSTSIVNLPMRLWLGLGTRYGFTGLPKIVQVGHHESHASVFFVSPFEDATILVMDGYGDESATTAWTGRGNKIERVWADGFFDSLGMLYTLVTRTSRLQGVRGRHGDGAGGLRRADVSQAVPGSDPPQAGGSHRNQPQLHQLRHARLQ